MKPTNTNSSKPQAVKTNNRPENKDNLDSRKNEEQDFKGSDTTHNKKEIRGESKNQHKKA